MKKQVQKDIKALEALDAAELAKEIAKAEKELFLLSMKHRANELKQSHTLGLQKKYLAKLQMMKTRI
ncbi:50S ribosomal protein L29 [Candidatus Gracilibacteria bacterium]|nr:50S ribosomal protein L29 [bacterium]NDK19547.1 50S ribosomal protein L29 [Candidatus Gracilibacteria bacterium]OIO77887.1 MAG: 50S ribosomal protein L29 [Candidatus Gracilibacteria bacterium CG1_02_38_174]PIQ11924.1 MAG: 50S ribosomal protein L29 [Candidatus Gracilibacteria bacterium CG18_big_fil_WC_8_21_14_2_50_38_16]PIQ41243.1 MAG: 50S ribosomal protein L29 [Candidatus Gracilibacteria bacterium CG12_big_fil_rev_8_21_14_0_65_38_15]PIZ01844.1 MAG: 50S ribosomal protein L29 [Candidatus Grac